MPFLLLILAIVLSGCSSTSSSQGDFYTWVDERGQIHTIKTKKEVKTVIAKPVAVTEKETNKPNEQPKMDKVTFNTSDFISSEEVDKKLSGQKLYSWDQDGRQVIAEINTSSIKKEIQIDTESILKAGDFSISLLGFREGKVELLSDLLSKQLVLENVYITQEKSRKDYVLIELDIASIQSLKVKSFVDDKKVALPIFNLLDAEFNASPNINNAFNNYIEETWASFGFFEGNLDVPLDARYILIRPNPMPAVVETADGDITLIDLGSIQITF